MAAVGGRGGKGNADFVPVPECPTPEEQAYFDSLDRLLRDMVEELEGPFRLAEEPYIGSLEASVADNQLMAVVEEISDFMELMPPESLRTFHSDVVTVVDPIRKGAVLMGMGFLAKNRELIRDGIFVTGAGGLEPVDRIGTMRREWCD